MMAWPALVAIFAFAVVATVLLAGFEVMIAAGAVHSAWRTPSLGYWSAVGLGLPLAGLELSIAGGARG